MTLTVEGDDLTVSQLMSVSMVICVFSEWWYSVFKYVAFICIMSLKQYFSLEC